MLFQRFRQFSSAYHQGQRLRDIATVLVKYGYDDLSQHLPLPKAKRYPFRKFRKQQEHIHNLSQPVRLRRACEELGPTFIKLGQLFAARTRILPQEFIDELEKLQDQVTPLEFDDIRIVIESEIRCSIDQIFSDLDRQPLASASIAQVHAAKLIDGTSVVLKVQRPGIEKAAFEDLGIIRQLAQLAESHLESWRLHKPVAIVEELARNLKGELDFTREASNLERFAWQFRDEPSIYIPKIWHELTTKRLLVMERVEGIKISDLAKLETAQLDPSLLATRIADLLFKQIFVHGFFHADPHPGNIHILSDQRVCFLDFGMMGFINHRSRKDFVDLIWGISRRNETNVAVALLKLAKAEVEPERDQFESDIAEFMHSHFYRSAGEIDFSKLIIHLVHITTKHKLSLPPDIVVMLKALSLTEQVVRRLNPNHNLIAQAAPLMKQTRLRRLRPRRVLESLLSFGSELTESARDLPSEFKGIISQIKTGRSRINFRHEGLEPATNTFERSTNRLAFALVVSALIISSSIILQANVPPLWNDVSILGLLGYVLAGLMGFWLLISVVRHGKM